MSQLERFRTCIDMAELRVDLLDPDQRLMAEILPSRTDIPLILTIRLPEDGGKWGAAGESDEDRADLFLRLLGSGGWKWVDLEYNHPLPAVVRAAQDTGTRTICSVHDFEGTVAERPVSETAGLLRLMAKDGAIPKLALSCNSSRQLLSLARLAVATSDIEDKVILGMGEYGLPTRILAGRMGSAWTYASSLGGEHDPPAAAPGQLDPHTLQDLYRFSGIGPATALYAVTGNPVAHSRSPEIHNRWLSQSGLDASYILIRSDDAAAMLETCDIWGITGLSVTVPHKERALALCDYSGVLARSIGAANTLIRAGDGWRARNTDAGGFMAPLPEALGVDDISELRGMRALVIGAGGAARAAVHALSDAGVVLTILNRTVGKARILAEEVGACWGGLDESSSRLLEDEPDFCIQTTAAGMHPLEVVDPLPWWDFSGCRLVYDMVYVPAETLFLKRAREAGLKVMNGSKMLVNQARLQFVLFTGIDAPADD